MSTNEDLDAANSFVQSNLLACCMDIEVWHNTGKLPDRSVVYKAAELYRKINSTAALSLVENYANTLARRGYINAILG